ncbi:MAG: type II toxin-antitoxin system Phd/YefM family antitoxin [SAR202 cluster bacterium]|nr:type II toxin-antitoxin system Phd/YefM family antitoxin [SAR202 cluster bacterium]
MEIGVRELREHASDIVRRVREEGETVIITYRGKAVARIEPIADLEARKELALEVWAEMDKLSEEIGSRWPEGVTAVAAMRDERE